MSKKGLLWKISGNALPQSSYLFGTMHVRDDRAFGLFDLVKEKILECEAYASEFKLDDAKPVVNQQSMLLPEGQTLDKLMKRKKLKQLNQFLQNHLGVSVEQINRQKPIMLGNLITSSLFQENQAKSLDETLFEFAKKEGKTMMGIETYEEQLGILDKIPMDKQVKFLFNIINDFGNHQEEVDQIAAFYQAQDLEGLYRYVKKNTKGLTKILLNDRNKVMAKRIHKMIQKQSLFVSIGAGHLAGKKGVLNRLIRKGYFIEAI